ncbi:MAG: Lin1244/Lin1753 domain-containing protein [Mangrovibacterium sp.]
MSRPRKNNAEYFSHDSDMRNNRKVKALRAKHGNTGYACFCMTLEMLTDADNFTVTLDEVEMELIAADFGFTVVELRDIWNTAKNLRLIELENDNLSCHALVERLQPVLNERIRQREKAAKRWLSKGETKPGDNSTGVLPRENDAPAMQSKGKKRKENISVIFDQFRVEYPGTKRSLKTEFENFLKKNKPEVVELLLPALNKEKEHRYQLARNKQFAPEWKNLSTWINQRCWEQEFPEVKPVNGKPQPELLTPAKGLQR